ncbi:MAG TPA: tyrosine/phenylalanine carboxypeptidase domain-containing protein [Longimicrobiales bacterium]|nr:tyrosine/phenylalanine carboxypeptidase domain-containing protein [Longimicrobiales bacterium]
MSSATADSTLIERTLRRFRTDAHVRERLPGGGVLNLDRKLPYLFVYRQPQDREDSGTHRLVLGEASYLVALGEDVEESHDVIAALAETATRELDSFLVLEIWSGDPDSTEFVVHAPSGAAAATVDVLCRGLRDLRDPDVRTTVEVRQTDVRHPPDLPPLLTTQECWDIGCLLVGLEVPPIFRDSATGDVYPVFLRRLRHLLSGVLRQMAFEFARVQTSAGFESYRAVGPRTFGREVADADEALAEIESSYQLLLLVSPVNSSEAWVRFRDSGFTREPEFRYRLLPVDPDSLKRRLFAVDLEPVADPAMAFLLRDKRDELDRQITLIGDRNADGVLYASMRLYGAVDDMLLNVARDVLSTVQPRRRERAETYVRAAEFAAAARTELDYYRASYPELAAEVQVRPDLVGLMVSQGNLLIGENLSLRPERVLPLLHHEVGTHVLTYYNGRAQPLRQLYTGLAGYDELQEGLAVLAEYLSDGLSAARMRVLAARVIAARSVEDGASFMDTFRLLTADHGLPRATAFDIATRIHASGGFTRDLIYLRGLLRLVEYVRAGGAIEPLYVGKIAAKHVPIIDELRAREYVRAPVLLPRLFEQPATSQRLDALRDGLLLTRMISDAA